jgi:hypothetical protein
MAHSEMGFSASEIASTAFSNPKIDWLKTYKMVSENSQRSIEPYYRGFQHTVKFHVLRADRLVVKEGSKMNQKHTTIFTWIGRQKQY